MAAHAVMGEQRPPPLSGPPGPSGASGTVSHSGTSVIDFGLTPSSEATVVVGDQDGIDVNTRIRAWVTNERHMSDNDENSHLMAGTFFRLVCGSVIPDVSFTIYVTSTVGLVTGRFRIDWIWSA